MVFGGIDSIRHFERVAVEGVKGDELLCPSLALAKYYSVFRFT